MTARRSTADIAWEYSIDLHGSTLLPAMFGKLEHSTPETCMMLGEPAELSIETDYPTTGASITAYSYGYFLRNYPPYNLRLTKSGVDIPVWERAGSNYKGETSRSSEILSYENPSYHVKRLLWPLDDNGNPTSEKGYYNLYLGRVEPVPNWGIGQGKPCTLSATLLSGATTLSVSDLSLFPAASATTQVKIFTYEDEDDDGAYDEGEKETAYEVCRYTAKSAASGAGTLTIIRTKQVTWNASVSMAVNLEDGFNPKHLSIEKKQFFFDGMTVTDILSELADHCNMIRFTKFKYVGGEWREYFYWVAKYQIDDGNYLELPTPITVTPSTSNLIGSPGPGATIGLEQSYNAVIVEACRVKDSAWFYGFACKSTVSKSGDGFIPGTEIPRVLMFRTNSLLPEPAGSKWVGTVNTETNYGPGGVNYGTVAENAECQWLANAKANQVLQYANYQVPTYTASFRDIELDLYQSITFTGFPNFPEDVMQITEITRNYNDPGSGGYSVDITCSKKLDLQESGKFQSIIDEIQANNERLKESISESGDSQKVGVVIATYKDGSMATVQSRMSGGLIKTRSYGLRAAP